MKFHYETLKRIVPSAPPIEECARLITNHLFEVESAENGILDIAILPNRYSDAACYWGLARELQAMRGKAFAYPKLPKFKKAKKTEPQATIGIANLCRRFMACRVSGLSIKPSPGWMQDCLAAHGMRPINNVVDITNYVTLETGQPLHAFDAEKISGSGLIVRQAQEGETVETLDHAAYALTPSALVIADAERALDIAGIKGGRHAEITARTKTILLTAINVDGSVVYKTARRINLHTDASARFSHSLSPHLAERGMRRALELLGELCGGKAGGVSDAFPKGQAARSIRCNEKGCAKLTGITVTRAQYAEILARLHCTVRGASVLPPADRTDLALPEDIYEEIARIVGYEAVRPEPLRITLVPPEIDGERAIEQAALDACVRAGCIEARNYALDATGAVALENPVSADHAYLRQSLMPHLMAACARNLRHEREVRLCEAGRVFLKRATHEPAEKAMIGAAYGAVQSDAEYGVRVVRGIIDALCASLAVGAWSYEEADEGLAVIIGGERAGTLAWRTEDAMCICAAEIARDALARHARKARYAPAPKYPAIVRDISFIVPRSVRAGALLQAAERAMPAHCSAIEYIGAYADDRLPANARSITIRLVFRSAERTLTDREAEEGVSAVANTLKTQFGIETR